MNDCVILVKNVWG